MKLAQSSKLSATSSSVSVEGDSVQSVQPFIRVNFEAASDYGPYIVAIQFAKNGKPLLSAAAHLTVSDVASES